MKKSILYQDKNIVYTVSGNGPVLVLLHGFLESKAIWDDFTETLQNDFTIVAIDLPGHGESDLIAESHTMELMAGAIKEVLKVERIEQVIITGHSLGGYVALQFAVDNEELVKGLVLFHSYASADTEEAKENRRRTINIVKQNRGGFIRQFIPDLFDQKHVENYTIAIQKLQDQAALMTSDAIIAALKGMRDRPNQLQYLLLAEIPVLFIIGKQDSRIPYSQVMAQAVIPSHSEILLLEDVGHMGYIEAPGKTLQALKHFAIRCYEG
ncbi:MAG: alpha/beta hydrolase [Lentimicrobiaceae bacterium]|jgi:pimeloyl-ACP methyl ester carboxylesterase